jgi:large-conductance mechanosensitive channel
MTYPSKELIKNITPTARTLSEANQDAEYACAVISFKTDTKLAWGFLVDAVIGFVITACMLSPFAVGFWLWVNR